MKATCLVPQQSGRWVPLKPLDKKWALTLAWGCCGTSGRLPPQRMFRTHDGTMQRISGSHPGCWRCGPTCVSAWGRTLRVGTWWAVEVLSLLDSQPLELVDLASNLGAQVEFHGTSRAEGHQTSYTKFPWWSGLCLLGHLCLLLTLVDMFSCFSSSDDAPHWLSRPPSATTPVCRTGSESPATQANGICVTLPEGLWGPMALTISLGKYLFDVPVEIL